MTCNAAEAVDDHAVAGCLCFIKNNIGRPKRNPISVAIDQQEALHSIRQSKNHLTAVVFERVF